jgi:phage terminase large subunit-like protein
VLEVNKYIANVHANKVSACDLVHRSLQRHLDDLEKSKSKKYPFEFVEEEAQHVFDFFCYCKHSKGEWAGTAISLEPWQKFIISQVFGWRSKETGLRRYRVVYIEVPRKNGKTTFTAAIGLYQMVAEGEMGAEIYSVASKKDQARIVFDEARNMVRSSRALQEEIEPLAHNLNCLRFMAKFQPLGKNANSLDGLNVQLSIHDELHAWKDESLYSVMETATGSRRHPIIWNITTAGFDKSLYCYELREYTRKILTGVIEDDTHFGIIYTIDEGDDWKSKKTWEKANPNWNVSVKPDDMERLCRKAEEITTNQNAFLCKRLNIWTSQESRWLDMDAWAACDAPLEMVDLVGENCVLGLDLSSTTDICACVYTFLTKQNILKLYCRFFLPEDAIYKKSGIERSLYDRWVRDGFIITTEGRTLDYEVVYEDIENHAEKFNITHLAYDPWNAAQAVKRFDKQAMEMVAVRQGVYTLNDPCKMLEKFVLAEAVVHGNNPVLTWMADNVVVKYDDNNNITPSKKKSLQKIDGISASVTAMSIYKTDIEPKKSVYSQRGVRVL